jgi:hypothetical protein
MGRKFEAVELRILHVVFIVAGDTFLDLHAFLVGEITESPGLA